MGFTLDDLKTLIKEIPPPPLPKVYGMNARWLGWRSKLGVLGDVEHPDPRQKQPCIYNVLEVTDGKTRCYTHRVKIQPHELDLYPPGSEGFAEMMAFKYAVAHINVADLMLRDIDGPLGPPSFIR